MPRKLDEDKTHPVTFLDDRTLRIEAETRLAKTIRRAISGMTRAKFKTDVPETGMKIIFDESLAKKPRSCEDEVSIY